MKYIATILLTLLMSSDMAFSQGDTKTHRLDSIYRECLNNLKGEIGKIDCARTIMVEWDKELNKYYKLIMGVIDPAAQDKLKLAQRQWIKYRDQESDFSDALYIDIMDGTMYPRLGAYRKMDLVRIRALELKRYYWILTEEE